MHITNKHNVDLSIAALLVSSDYDYDNRPTAISATTILKPIRALALQKLYKGAIDSETDVVDLVASSTGSAVHAQLENTWLNPDKVTKALKLLGYGDTSILVNPTEVTDTDAIVVYVEKRSELPIKINGTQYFLTGKFDMVFDGKLEDLKNTGSFKVTKALSENYTYNNLHSQIGFKRELEIMKRIATHCPTIWEYAMQGSIYRLLNPKIITKSYMTIQFIIKDWQKYSVHQKEHYPKMNPLGFDIKLFSREATLAWIKAKLSKLDSLTKEDLPLCNDIELWRNKSLFKVFKDKSSTRALPKATFDNYAEAMQFNSKRRVAGVIKEIPSKPKRCNYCSVRSVCEQYKGFVREGLIED
jgi:hypothetical protein